MTLLVVAATEPELHGLAACAVDVEALACGVGPVDAAIAVADRLAREPRPSAVLHIGIAGCRRAAGIRLGTLVIGSDARYCDTTSRLVEQHAAPDPGLLACARAGIPDAPLLPIGTAADVGGTSSCDVEAMEGFAVLRAAQLAGVPAVEVRALANEIEEPDRSLWQFDLALDALAAALPALVDQLSAGVNAH